MTTPDTRQKKVAATAGIVLVGFALAVFALDSQALHPVPSLFVAQTANILLISGLVCLIAAFHAGMLRLAVIEELDLQDAATRKDQALFDVESDVELRHQRALRQFRVWILPVLILFISALECFLAVRVMSAITMPDVVAKDVSPYLYSASLLGAFAFVCFVGSRYCVGLSFGKGYSMLRAVATAITAGLCACLVGATVSLLGYAKMDDAGAWGTRILCGVAIYLAVERVLVWVLDLYRPKTKLMEERPVYESRMLSLFTQPRGLVNNLADLLEYQFGLRISRRRLAGPILKTVAPLILLQLVVVLLLSCIVYIHPFQQGVVEDWRRDDLNVLEPGLYLRQPWPLSRVTRLPAHRIQQFVVHPMVRTAAAAKERPLDVALWQDESLSQPLLLAAGHRTENDGMDDGAYPIPVNLVTASVAVQYHIHDVRAWLKAGPEAAELLQLICRRELSAYMLSHDLIGLLSLNYDGIRDDLTAAVQHRADALEPPLGITIDQINILRLQPPPALAPAFRRVAEEKENRRRVLTEAEANTIQLIAEGDRRAHRIRREAESNSTKIVARAKTEVTNFNVQRGLYSEYPEIYRVRATMDAIEEWLTDARKFIIAADSEKEVINFDLKDVRTDLLDAIEGP